MTPTPQQRSSIQKDFSTSPQLDGNRIVISGMSGLYPASHNVKELSDILYNKINPITQEGLRYKYNHPELVQYAGTVPDIGRFDAQFFKVNYRLGITMDPKGKKVLEQSYQAIYDAGINPEQLSGTKVGVYVGACFSETDKTAFYDMSSRSGLGIAGCSKTMFANRISYWLNAKGPSMAIDEACCSSIAALEQAYLAMTRGECETAIVSGSQICLHPQSSVHSGRIVKCCSDGKTKSFDERADGCVNSEAISVLFLQKAKDALRIYAEVINVKTEFTCMLQEETGPKFGFYRSISSTANFIRKFYEDTQVPPQAIEYVEAFGSATNEADKSELQAIEEVFCKDRDDPLFIGSVMSNIGYTEAASGISAITKVLLGYHNGKLAANLHCEHPRQDIAAIREGRMRVVTEHQEFGHTYVAVNGMSVSGINSHVLLHGYYKPKMPNRYKSNIPWLVNVSGRYEDAVKYVFKILKSNPVDPEQLALLHNIHRTSISGHLGRGFTILETTEDQQTVSVSESVQYFDDVKRPLWFVYSGMGSQWSGMGAQLMRIPIFAAAIERCRKALEPKGLDIVAIITSTDEKFRNILHSFVGIAAIQIGLTDILREIGLKPDGIIGHSVGELGCAYADGCLTAEEMILSAYYRGLVSVETTFIHGSMAAVGMGYKQISRICPSEIEVACHNGPESCTLSGPSDIMRAFVAELTSKGIFAKEVPCSNIAYHSRYIAHAGPELLKYLNEILTCPKVRSERWISSSVPEDRWNEPMAKLCSAEYLTNNLLSPVLFEETSRLIPNNAVLVEIAPHGLLQAILKRSLSSSCINIPLTRRNHPDNAVLLLEAIGKLYLAGYNSDLKVLYPKVDMPVSTGTPFLSHVVNWAHEEQWPLAMFSASTRIPAANCNFVIATQDKEHAYLEGHSMRGKTLYPLAASLALVWDTLAMIVGVPRKQLSVEFTDIYLHVQPELYSRRQLKLNVAIHKGTGQFEVLDGISKVVTGFIRPKPHFVNKYQSTNNKNIAMYYTAQDIYQLLRDRDYSYSGEFQSIKGVNESMSDAVLLWQGNWVTLIDGMLQLNALQQPHDTVSLPIRIRTISINVNEHTKYTCDSELEAKLSEKLDNTICGGIMMEGIQFKNLPPADETKLGLKSLTMISNNQSNLDVTTSLEVYFQIVAENVNKDVITVVGVPSHVTEGCIFKKVHNVIRNVYGVKINYKQITTEMASQNDFRDVDLVLVQNLTTDDYVLKKCQQVLQSHQFVVSEEDQKLADFSQPSSLYRVLFAHSCIRDDGGDQTELRLIRWGPKLPSNSTATVSVHNEADFKFLTSVRTDLSSNQRLLIITSYPSPPSLKELVKSWRKEAAQNKVYLVAVSNTWAHNLEEKLCDIDLAFNVLDHDTFGGEYYVSVKEYTTINKNHLTLEISEFGNYDSLDWVEAPELTGSGVTVTVHSVGINTNDISKANGLFNSNQNVENSFGSDFSGTTENGERVMGITSSGAASTVVRARPELLWPVPEHWSLEDAATVPLAYAQAFYCLAIKTRLQRGMTVLVHGGAGALGQAVISIALAHDCEVFTTISDIRKKRFLLRLFPKLKADYIGNSRDNSFGDMVLTATKGKGCDIIITSLKENLKDVSYKCIAAMGKCIDISQLQNQDNYTFGMHHLFVSKNYCTVNFASVLAVENIDEIKIIHQMVSEGIARGYVRPLTRLIYKPNNVSRAFRLLAISQHRGRVLLQMKENILQRQHRLRCSADNSHVLFCDKAMFGLQLADRLIKRGVKKLCLHVPIRSSYLEHKISTWQRSGVEVIIFSGKLDERVVSDMLAESLRQGSLQGVYVTTGSDDDSSTKESFIEQLDSMLRKLCPQLRYFAVLNVGSRLIGKNVCLQRVNDKLSGTVLMLPDFSLESKTGLINWRVAVDATEEALQTTESVLFAYADDSRRPSLLGKLTKLAGFKVPGNMDKSLTLQQLGVQSYILQSICNFLQVQYNLALDEEQVSSLTINKILELENVIESPYKDINGLYTFLNYVGSDELTAVTEMIMLPTIVNSSSMRDDEFDLDETYLCIIPGMEGHHERFRVMCDRLKLPALVLQPGLDRPYETARETAERFTKTLLQKTALKNTFYLLGYETGVLIALEMAAILENHGLTGTVFCVGCAPEELKQELEEQLAEYGTEKQLEDAVIRHMYTLMTGEDTTRLDNVLEKADTWPQKVNACVRVLLGRVSHSAQYARALIECALARVQQAQRDTVTITQPLRSQIVLLRAVHDPPQYETLQQYSRQPLVVHQLDARLAHISTDLNCGAIINEHLDPAILEAFSSRNICNTYLLNENCYTSLKISEI